jgi:hypothetical protein
MKRKLSFEGEALKTFSNWAKLDKKIYSKIVTLI